MKRRVTNSLALATATGSFKGAFAHGVLSAFEEAGIMANAYASASASDLGLNYWQTGIKLLPKIIIV